MFPNRVFKNKLEVIFASNPAINSFETPLFPNLIDRALNNEASLFGLRVHPDSAGCVKAQKSLRERAIETSGRGLKDI